MSSAPNAMYCRLLAFVLSWGLCASVSPVSAGTLDDVRQRGVVRCGVSEGLYGFSETNSHRAMRPISTQTLME
jgi:hypothetical protein